MSFETFKQWLYRHVDQQPSVKELVWVRRKICADEKIDWTFVDTVDYQIDSIPRKREIVFEARGVRCQHMKSLKQESLRRMEKSIPTLLR